MLKLRPMQEAALAALKKEVHLICVSPSGSGKSLIYEQHTLQTHSRTLLITPLAALARQQMARLQALGVQATYGPAPPPGSGAWILNPETLFSPTKTLSIQRVHAWKASFLVVDECHCLWEWGEDFRPAFRAIPELLKIPTVQSSLWLTATLPLHARKELVAMLPEPLVEQGKFALPPGLNLRLLRVPLPERIGALLNFLSARVQPGIIFVSTRKQTHRLERAIREWNRTQARPRTRIATYHAGLSREERMLLERRARQAELDIILATTAFGMGVDYSSFEWVILWQTPLSLLSFSQQIGRVGRSMKRGEAVLFWDELDFQFLEWGYTGSERRKQEFNSVVDFLLRPGCRRGNLQRYFEREASNIRCDMCDHCQSQVSSGLSSCPGIAGGTKSETIL